MSNKRDRDQILDSLEEEFRSDLSIHLYSTFLLHQINTRFPLLKWTSWPLDFERIPDPKSDRAYVNQNDKYGQKRDPEHLNGFNQHQEDDEYEIVSSPRDCLAIEIKAMIEKRISDRLKHLVSSNLSEELLDLITERVIPKVDQILETLTQYRLDACKADRIKRKLNWQDVLRAHLETSTDPDRTGKLFESCMEHFFNVRYKYEFEDREDHTSEVEDGIGEEIQKNDQNDENEEHRSKSIEIENELDILNDEYESAHEDIPGNQMALHPPKNESEGFCISEYLSRFEKVSGRPNFAQKLAKEQIIQDELIAQRNIWFFNRLQNLKETRFLSMERSSNTEIDTKRLTKEQERALLHGGILVDEESYYL